MAFNAGYERLLLCEGKPNGLDIHDTTYPILSWSSINGLLRCSITPSSASVSPSIYMTRAKRHVTLNSLLVARVITDSLLPSKSFFYIHIRNY